MGLDFLQNLLGGPQQQQQTQDFVNRYHQGPPEQGYSNQEVANHYQQIAPQLPQDVYMQSAQDAFARMTPQQREEFGTWLQTQAQQHGTTLPGGQATASSYQDPGALAQMTTQMQQQQPDLLGQLLGGQGAQALNNPFVKAAAAGIAAMAAQRILSRR